MPFQLQKSGTTEIGFLNQLRKKTKQDLKGNK